MRTSLFVCCLIGIGLAVSPVFGETLEEALASAYENNPVLRAERAGLRATDEGVSQALSGWRPNVSVTGSQGWQSTDSRTSGNTRLNPRSLSLDVTQPLYRGGRTVSSTLAAEARVQASRESLASTESQVLNDAVGAYLDVSRDLAVVELNRSNVRVLERQLEAAEDRFRVGEITRTDVAQAEARLSRSQAGLEQALGTLASSSATYRRVVGRAPQDLAPPPALPEQPGSAEAALSIGLEENHDLRAARHLEAGAGHDVRTAVGSLYPTVSLVGSLSHTEDGTFRGQETDAARLTAQVSVPLYQSGSAYSALRQARQTRSQRLLEIEVARRSVEERVTQAWESRQTALAEIAARRAEVRANEIALDGVRQEAQVGARTILDVLDAEQELLDARVALVRAERDDYVAAFTLLTAIGRLSAQNLKLPVQFYDPDANYRRIRDKLFGGDVDDGK